MFFHGDLKDLWYKFWEFLSENFKMFFQNDLDKNLRKSFECLSENFQFIVNKTLKMLGWKFRDFFYLLGFSFFDENFKTSFTRISKFLWKTLSRLLWQEFQKFCDENVEVDTNFKIPLKKKDLLWFPFQALLHQKIFWKEFQNFFDVDSRIFLMRNLNILWRRFKGLEEVFHFKFLSENFQIIVNRTSRMFW